MTMTEMESKMMAHNAIERVCALLGDVTTEQIYSKERTFKVATARQLVYWYLYYYGLTLSEIARAMDKHHATIMYGIRQINIMLERNRTKEDKRIHNAAEKLNESIKNNDNGSKDNGNNDESVQ